jgi:hypothetical protein
LIFRIGYSGAARIDCAVCLLRPCFENFATAAGTADSRRRDLISLGHRIEIGAFVWANSPNATQRIAAFGYVVTHTLPDLGNPLFVYTSRAYANANRPVRDVSAGNSASGLVSSFAHFHFLRWLRQNKNPVTAAGIVAAIKNMIGSIITPEASREAR